MAAFSNVEGADAAERSLVLRRIALGFASAQFAVLATLSILEVRDAALTRDFAIFFRAYTGIAAGEIDPNLAFTGAGFLRDHAALLMWLIAPLGRISSSALVLKLIQDVAASGATLVAELWCLDMLAAARRLDRGTVVRVAICADVMLVANPWTYWANAFDFHFMTIAALALVTVLRSFYLGRYRTAWCWVVVALTASEVFAPLMFGAALSLVAARRRLWRQALTLMVVSLSWLVLVENVVRPTGSPIDQFYGWLEPGERGKAMTGASVPVAILRHPKEALSKIVSVRQQAWGSLAPSGLIGFFSPWTTGPLAITYIENMLAKGQPSSLNAPGFQYAQSYPLMVPGFVWVLVFASRFVLRRSWVVGAAMLGAFNSIAWSAVWAPLFAPRWLTTSPEAAVALERAAADVGRDQEVVVDNGSIGLFASDPKIWELVREPVRVTAPMLRIIVAPFDGIELMDSSAALAVVDRLLVDPRAVLENEDANVWVFTYRPDPSAKWVDLAGNDSMLVGGVLRTTVGRRSLDLVHPAASYVATDGSNPFAGYLVESAYWREPPGAYRVWARLSCSTPCTAEVTDATLGTLLARREIRRPDVSTEVFNVLLRSDRGDRGPSGWGPFSVPPVDLKPHDRIELRVFVGAHAVARVERIGIDAI